MLTYHAIVWMDQKVALVVMFDKLQTDTVHVRSHSSHARRGRSRNVERFYDATAGVIAGVHEVLLTGPGKEHNSFRLWCAVRRPDLSKVIVASVPGDHPSDRQLVALARLYFKGFDRMATDPALAQLHELHAHARTEYGVA